MNKSKRYHPDSIQYMLLKEIEERQRRAREQLNGSSLNSPSISESSYDSGRYVSNNTQSPIHYRKQKPFPRRQLSPIGVTYKSSIINKKEEEQKPMKGNKKTEQQTQTYAEDFEEEQNIYENEENGGNIEEGSSPAEQEEEENEMSDTHNSNINTKRSSNRVSNTSINQSSKRDSQMSIKSNNSNNNNNTILPKRKSNISQKTKLNELEEDIKNNNNNSQKVNNTSIKAEQVKSNNETKNEEEKTPKQQNNNNNNNNNNNKEEIEVIEDAFEYDDEEEEKVKTYNINRPITDKEYETVCRLCIESMITELIEDEDEEEMGKLDMMIDTNVQKPVEQSLNSKIRKSIAEVQNVYLNKIDDMPKSRRASKLTEEIEKKAEESKEQEKKEDEQAKKVNIDDEDEFKKLAEIPSPDPMNEIILPDSNGNPQPPPALEVKALPKRVGTPIMEEDDDDEDEEADEAEEVDVNKKYASVFNDPITRAFLKAYMIKNFQEESIIFWETVKELEDIQKRVTKQQRKDYCQEIYDKFIKEGSEMEININASLRIKITDRIKKHPGRGSMFKEAKLEMEKLIVDNNYNDFLKSEFNTKAKAINDWFSVFSEFDDELKKAIAEKVYQIRGSTYLGQYFPAPTDEKQKKSNLSQLKSSYCMTSDTQSMCSFMSTSTWDSEIPSTPADLPRSIRIAGFD